MDEQLEMRESTEGSMTAQDQAATFEPFEVSTEGDIPDLSDDDIAASLGFHTTLSEPLIPQDEMDTAEDEAVETADESPETAEEADEEIAEENPGGSRDTMEEGPSETDILASRLDTLEMELERLKNEKDTND